jgi:hypothetical protein
MASYTKYYDEVNEYWRTSNVEGSAFLMIEAGAEIEFNLTRHFRLALGANYRITTQQKFSPGCAQPQWFWSRPYF